MSRHRHTVGHPLQPYDYENFRPAERVERNRQPTRAIKYEDDSPSPINSDDESYLQHIQKQSSHVYTSGKQSSSKPCKSEKNDSDVHSSRDHVPSTESSRTNERLDRLEKMLEELIKQRQSPPVVTAPVSEKKESDDGLFYLEPRKHGFTTSMWINKIQEVSVLNNWKEKSTIQYMEGHMSGIIKAWYKSLPNCDFTWPEWKILISKTFPDNVDFVTTLKRLVTRIKQQDESMTNYYFSKMYLVDACKITGEDAVSCLIDGLNNQTIQLQAKVQNFLTPETLYSQYLASLPDYVVDYTPFAAEPEKPDPFYPWTAPDANGASIQNVVNAQNQELEAEMTHEYEMRYEPPDDLDQYHQEVEIEEKRPVHSRLDKAFIKPVKFSLKNQQFKQQQQHKHPAAQTLCSNCFKRGHIARTCRKHAKVVLNHCNLDSHREDNMVIKDCFVNNHCCQALVDTGCSTVTIREELADRLGLDRQITSEIIHGYGGGGVRVLGCSEVDFEVDDVKAKLKLMVVPNEAQQVPLILGQAFISTVKMTLRNKVAQFF